MNDEEAFLQAIAANPEDDQLRLIYADWLEDHGDPRGEFIRVQCALAHLTETDPARTALQQRERELLQQYEGIWTKPLQELVDQWEFSRGLIEKVVLLPRSFVMHGERLFRLAPIRHVHFFRRNQMHITEIMFLARSAYLARLETMKLNTDRGIRDEDVRELTASPYLAGLRCLDLSDNWIGNQGAIYLANTPHLEQVRSLKLGRNRIGPAGKRVLRARFGDRVSF